MANALLFGSTITRDMHQQKSFINRWHFAKSMAAQ